MAVLNPLLSLIERGEKPSTVCLLATSQSNAHAEAVKQYLVQKGMYDCEDILKKRISSTMNQDDDGYPPAHQILTEMFPDAELVFNVAGGMNFQVVVCARQMNMEKCLFLYPETDCIHAVRICAGNMIDHQKYSLPAPLDPVELLVLQGEKFQIVSRNHHRLLTAALNACKIKAPANGKALIIKNVTFDYVWNCANGLKYVKVLDENAGISDVRALIEFALNRDNAHELYHREVAAITNDFDNARRLRDEGGGKIVVLQKTKGNASFLPTMRRFFNIAAAPRITENPLSISTGNTLSQDSELYTVLGADITPTLIAVWSHKPQRLHLIYTPSDHQIVKLKESMLKFKHLLPVENVTFHPVSINGHEVLNICAGNSQNMLFNVTPGTKAQGLFMMLLALRNRSKIFTIKTSTQTLEEIPNGQSMPLCGPDPLELLLLKGHRVIKNNYGLSRDELVKQDQLYECLLKFIKIAVDDNKDIMKAYLHGFDWGRKSLKWINQNEIRLNDEEDEYRACVDRGACFEQLIGYVMMKTGADDLRVRLRTSKDGVEERQLEERFPGQVFHRTDVDVISRFQSIYYAISCKSGSRYKRVDEIETIKAVATLFGRFTIPLFVALNHSGDPIHEKGIYIFGPKTFTDQNAMRTLLQSAAQNRRKTDI